MDKKTVKDIDLKGKRVLMRVDFNVPMADGKVTDDKRIKAALPTIQYVLEQGASLMLMSHLGRPKGGPEAEFSLKAASETLAGLLGRPVKMAPDCVGPEVEALAKALKPGDVLMLEPLSTLSITGKAGARWSRGGGSASGLSPQLISPRPRYCT
jgi:phosphoglycerate kinase